MAKRFEINFILLLLLLLLLDVPIEQQVSPDSTSPSSQTHLPGSEHPDDISIDSYRGYPSPTNYKGISPDHTRGARSPGIGGPDTTDNISNQNEMEEEENHEQLTVEVREMLLY